MLTKNNISVHVLYAFGIISLLAGFFVYFNSYDFFNNPPYGQYTPIVSLILILLSPILFKVASDKGSKSIESTNKATSAVIRSGNMFIVIAIGSVAGFVLLFFALVALVAFSGSGNF